nr:MAG TPA: hypothetical protein [Caudoviricetes sp.]
MPEHIKKTISVDEAPVCDVYVNKQVGLPKKRKSEEHEHGEV